MPQCQRCNARIPITMIDRNSSRPSRFRSQPLPARLLAYNALPRCCGDGRTRHLEKPARKPKRRTYEGGISFFSVISKLFLDLSRSATGVPGRVPVPRRNRLAVTPEMPSTELRIQRRNDVTSQRKPPHRSLRGISSLQSQQPGIPVLAPSRKVGFIRARRIASGATSVATTL